MDSKGNGSCCKEGQICCDGICREYSENGSCCHSHLTDKYYYCENGCCNGLHSSGAVICLSNTSSCPPIYENAITATKDVKPYNRTYGAIIQKDVSSSIKIEEIFDAEGRLESYQVTATEKTLTPEEECIANPETHWMPRTSNRAGRCMDGSKHPTQPTSSYGTTTSSGYGTTKPVVGGQDELSTDIPLSKPCADHINVLPVQFQIINFVADDGLKTDTRVVTNTSDSKSKISKAEKMETPQLGIEGYSPPGAKNTKIKGSITANIQSDGNLGEVPLITFVSGSNIRLDTNDKASFIRISVDDLYLHELVDVDDDTVKEPNDEDVLVWDNVDKLWKAQQQLGTTGPTGPLGGSNYEILFNATGGASGNSNLTYNYNTNTFGTTAECYFYSGFTAEGDCNFNDNVVDGAKLKDYSEVVYTNTITGITHDTNINISFANVHTVSIDALVSPTLTFGSPIASGDATSLTLFITDGATAGGITWPTSVKWSGGNEPALSASGTDVVSFTTIDGGTAWYGFVGGIGFS